MPCMRKALCARSRQQQTRKDEDHMKKFLSLLLALTLVLSLVVVPARAEGVEVGGTYAITTSASSLARGDSTTFTVTATAPTVTDNGVTATDVNVIGYSWSTPGFSGAAGTGATTGTLTASNKAENVEVSCTLTIEYKVTIEGQEITRSTTKVVKSNVSIADKLLPGDITTVTFNNRTYSVTNGAVNISLLDKEKIDAADNKWSAAATGYVIDNTTNKPTYSDSTHKLTVKTTATTPLSTEITVTTTAATVTAKASLTEVISGGKTTLTATSTGLSNAATYAWFYKIGDSKEFPIGTGKSLDWTVPANVTTATDYSVYCKASEGDKLAKTSDSITVKSLPDTYAFTVVPASVTLTQIGQTATLAANFMNTSTSPATPVTPTYSFVPANFNIATVTNQTTAAPTVTLRASGSTTVTAKATYKGKDYVQNIPVTGALIEATLSAVQNGTSVNYSYSDLVNAAQAAINKTYSTAYTYETVYSLSGVTQVASTAAYGVGTSNASYNYPAGGSGYLYFKANLSGIGTAKFTATVTTRVANSNVPKTYSVTFNVPVTPSSTTYADQYPEPVAAYGNTYRYYVQVPSGARYYYVAGVNTEPVDWNNGSTQKYYPTTATANLYSLTDTNFINGKCTLYVVTQGTDNKLYCGTISVYQKNYNINYNGVAGETVQFAQSDFNDFMNKVAEARGDASKSKSYPYVTFDYVSFSLPTTAQGTLYYGGTAMSTSNSSGAFNTRTKVTNLDSVTFVPNDKTTAKTITLNFTLYATRYSSSSTSRGTTVSYSGSVVVNLVREDIKYTVSQGDSVRFDESDFLSYLSSTKGYSSNYTIDYVTFDQSAVSAVNEGSLYTYYSGYNYGGSVKTTDKFYYSATASQNALSDVAFLASRYAKTGETVYIPFTIYARYGTTGTGTRQLTGTVAIKIGQTMNFIDVKTTDYFYDSVKWAVNKGVTTGTSSTTFSPYNPCKRAEIVTFLWRAAGSPEPTTTRNPFRDVNAVTHSSYYKAILWASQKGIAAGTSTTTFSPDQVCTRAQIVTFLYRYAGKPSGYYSNPFKDVSATNEASYYNAILWASGKGITTGSSPTTFSPYASCNRAEAVTFLYRYTNGL
ncbi:S-layer homology domain-containing protein [Ruminococcaceae bacterium TF06-43]|nr:S-layer homology domain-containing protein [Ruminococcaceae bacterium TF06-43]